MADLSAQAKGRGRTAARFGRDRFITVSADSRYLMRNGSPLLLMGDSPHGIFCHLNAADVDILCANRAGHGFNCLWAELFETEYTGNGRADWTTYDGIAPFTGTLAGPGGPLTGGAFYDMTTPNEAYFARADSYIDIAESHGIILLLDPFETGAGMITYRQNGTTRMTTWGKYIGNRYRDRWNIIWQIGNDYLITAQPDTTDSNLGKAVLDGIAAGDPDKQRTAEFEYYMSGTLDNAIIRPSCTIAGAYTYWPSYYKVYDQYSHASGPKPVFLQEGFYEDAFYGGGPIDRKGMRAQAYHAVLSGALAGYIYGSIYTDPFSASWKTDMETNGVTDLTKWKNFFTSKAWHTLIPDWSHAVVTAGYGTRTGNGSGAYSSDTYCSAAADSLSAGAASLCICYVYVSTTITVDLTKFRGTVLARWFDPTNGTYTSIGSFANNDSAHQFTHPGNNSLGVSDWVLVLEA